MILVQTATALAIGAYAVLSKDSQSKRPDAIPRESVTKTTVSAVNPSQQSVRTRTIRLRRRLPRGALPAP
jgi:hypothetical protein